jgi:hypothetical protein
VFFASLVVVVVAVLAVVYGHASTKDSVHDILKVMKGKTGCVMYTI